jgi:hypothetical protein
MDVRLSHISRETGARLRAEPESLPACAGVVRNGLRPPTAPCHSLRSWGRGETLRPDARAPGRFRPARSPEGIDR